MNAEIEQILINLEEYFDDRADAECKDGSYIINVEMQRLSDVIRLKELLNEKTN
jgi:hypothetical protein